MSYSVHVHTPDPQSSDPATAGTARTGNRAAYGRILALALPTFGQLIAEPTFVLIDTAIVGHIGVSALAGLSIGSTIILTAVGLYIFLAYSTTAQVAHLLGAGRRREGLQAGIDGLWLALGIGVVLAAALFAGARPLCVALRGTGETLDQAVAYTQAVVLGAPGMLLVYAANGIFRGLQKVRITLVAAVCGAVLNTMLDVLFVFGFGWGIAGSGAATMIAQWFMGLFLTVPAVLWAKADGAALSSMGGPPPGRRGWPAAIHPHTRHSRRDGDDGRLGGPIGNDSAGGVPGGELVLEFRDEYAGFGRHRRSDPGGRGDGRRRPRTHTATDPGHGTSRIGG